MKRLLLSALVSLTPLVAHAEVKVVSGVGLEGSEAARYDAAADRWVVTNLSARGADNNGFLTLMSPDGTVTELKWVAGGVKGVELRDPLGLAIAGDIIYVADKDAVRKFDRATGASRGSIPVPGAVRLNDIAVAKDGALYVTDSGSDEAPGAIYRIAPNGRVSEFAARSEALERPNGVAVLADGTVVHGGRGVNLVYRAPDGRILKERTLPTGQMDGILPLPDGSLLVASQLGKVVYRLPAAGKPVVVAKDIEVPAAIGWDSKRNRLAVPQITASSVTFVDLD